LCGVASVGDMDLLDIMNGTQFVVGLLFCALGIVLWRRRRGNDRSWALTAGLFGAGIAIAGTRGLGDWSRGVTLVLDAVVVVLSLVAAVLGLRLLFKAASRPQ
jgi:hypothetical protein